MYCLIVLKAGSPKTRCWQGHRALKALKKGPFLPLSASILGGQSLAFLGFAAASPQPPPRSSHTVLPACLCPNFSFQKDANHIGSGFTLMTSFSLDYVYKHPISKLGHIHGQWSLGFQHTFWAGIQFNP